MVMLMCLWFFGDSIPEIKNSVSSGKKEMVFHEDLRFGGGEEANYLWQDSVISCDLDVNAKGDIFVRDMGSSRILHFDGKGVFKAVIATKGEGPGEFQQANYWGILNEGAVGYDMAGGGSSFVYFDKNYRFQNETSVLATGYIPRLVKASPDGNWIFAQAFQADGNSTNKTAILMDRNLKVVEELWSMPTPAPDGDRMFDVNMWKAFLVPRIKLMWEENRHFVSFGYDGSIYKVDGASYRIEKWDATNKKKLMVVEREYTPIPFTERTKQSIVAFFQDTIFEQVPQVQNVVTEKVLDRAVEDAQLPRFQYPIQGLIPADDGHFAVIHRVDHGEGTVSGHYFSPAGKCLARFDYPGSGIFDVFGIRLVIRAGFFYGLEKNEDGDNQVVRYRFSL